MGELERLDRVAGGLADDVELALQRIGDGHAGAAADEHLADDRLDPLDRFAEIAVVDRHVAPAEQDLSLVLDGALDLVLAGEARRRLLRQEHHAHAVLAERRQGDALLGHFLAEELVRHLDQDAGAVARLGVGAHRAAVSQVLEDQQPLLDDGVALLALDVGDEADAAGIVFVGWVVQTLRLGKTGLVHGFTFRLPAGSAENS